MDDFDFDELFELLEDGDDEPDPSFRATIRRGRLTLTNWAPWLFRCGPLGALVRERERCGVAIADLTLHGEDDDEVSVRFYAAGPKREEAERILIEWAARVGYRRVWLPDRLVEIEPAPEQTIGTAAVRCPTCLAHWADAQPEFWLQVRESGAFPMWCPACGCELPQWTVRGERKDAPEGKGSGSGEWAASGSGGRNAAGERTRARRSEPPG
jgi:hypothetical protein